MAGSNQEPLEPTPAGVGEQEYVGLEDGHHVRLGPAPGDRVFVQCQDIATAVDPHGGLRPACGEPVL